MSQLFKDVKYFLIGKIDDKIKKLLDDGGGKSEAYLSGTVTHAIADDCTENEFNEAKDIFDMHVITSRWVELSVRCEVLLPAELFLTSPTQLFSGLRFCASNLSASDVQTLWALITGNGGECQNSLDRSVTHLITTRTTGIKYEVALKRRGLFAVTPDWVADSVGEGHRVAEAEYHPSLLCSDGDAAPTEDNQDVKLSQALAPVVLESLKSARKNKPEAVLGRAKESLSKLKPASKLELLGSKLDTPEEEAEFSAAAAKASALAALPRTPIIPRAPGAPRGPRATSPRATSPARVGAPRGPRGPRSPKSPRGPRLNLGASPQPSNLLIRDFTPPRLPTTPSFPLAPPVLQAPLYVGHDAADTVPEDVPLMGCHFYIVDYPNFISADMLDIWKKVIVQHGGEVEAAYNSKVTHLLCDNQRSEMFHVALKEKKRLVSAHWLNDVLTKKKLLPPWLPTHFPSAYKWDEKPCQKDFISVTNFEGDDREVLKHMIQRIGAQYTSYLTAHNSALVAKTATGRKYEKAVQWKVNVVNITWLVDILLGDLSALKLPLKPCYGVFAAATSSLTVEPSRVAHLMQGWRTPIHMTADTWNKVADLVVEKQNWGDSRKRKADDEEPRDAKVAALDSGAATPPADAGAPAVLFTGLDRGKQDHLSQVVRRLGGTVLTSAEGCTHLVAEGVVRTVKFLTAFSACSHVVAAAWLEQSERDDELQFPLADPEAEKSFNYSIAAAMQRAKQRKLFSGLRFFLTPSVQPGKTQVHAMIESAGGVVAQQRPALNTFKNNRNEQGQCTFIVISCAEDQHLVKDLITRDFPLHSAEFVMTGILRQELDYASHRLQF